MCLYRIFSVYPEILLSDFLRYFVTAGLFFLIFWVFLKKKLRHRLIQKEFPKAKRLWFEFGYSISTVIIFSFNGLGIYTAIQLGWTQIYLDFYEYGWIYFVFSLMLMLIFNDTYFYWTHRLMHHPKIYRYVHSVHHKSTNPSPWAAYSFHPIEAIVQAMTFTIMVYLFPIHPITMFIFLTFMIVRNVHGHLGFELFPKSFIHNKWLNWHTTTTHHNLHHSKFNCNYGLYFTFWDNLMGTTLPDYKRIFNKITEG